VNVPYPVPPELTVLDVARRLDVALDNADADMREASIRYAEKHDSDNMQVRFLSKRRAYAVTVYFDAQTLAANRTETT
jgi:hypothetical protein